MENKTAAIIGATGLIGSLILEQLLRDRDFSLVKVIVRRPFTINNPKVQVSVIDFANHEAFKQAIAGSDVVFCAVGTTQKKVGGDQDAYRKVDFDIPVTAARLCAETGVDQFLLVSSVGANSGSKNFYLKLKGEVEDAVRQINIPSISIFRPSMLLGKRQEFRLGERVGQILMKLLSFLIPSKYKPIQAEAVAKAMIATCKQERPGFNIYLYEEMKHL
ncbi:NAD(P)H-binding protein [Chitinophagaceae bacterium LB-8]|uniref:NAD(P)H-binding protein n=1 Tax=Paraflavisolibacter caeni TaxID=2982496 RepID=A0A9X3B7T1_9BACT|nr:NAD(P)H-binding protein [Paraflavisolibacter caeni]MCU7549680.1 NAD(P)H-binding protein [Paraflavisolibacter caeni]